MNPEPVDLDAVRNYPYIPRGGFMDTVLAMCDELDALRAERDALRASRDNWRSTAQTFMQWRNEEAE